MMDRQVDELRVAVLSTGILEESSRLHWVLAFCPYTSGNWGKQGGQ